MDNKDFLNRLEDKEKNGGLEYDSLDQQKAPNSLGKASFVDEMPQQSTLGMESPWKPLPISNLPSEGFGYPDGMEIAIRACQVSEIRHYSTIDEYDPIDVDDKINHILSKNTQIRYTGGILNYMDLYQEDRFYLFMVIRDITFAKGENKLMVPVKPECKDEKCVFGSEIEVKSSYLTSFKLPKELNRYYDQEKGSYVFTPKNGDSPMELFIPTIGVVTKVRKILRDKKNKGKKYDESFAPYSTFIIPNWRELDESMYDYFEAESKNWTYTQFNIVDQMTQKITFATKNQISVACSKCGAEVTAPLRFRGGLRSLYIISDIFDELL
jgi:hypothetical protein